MTEEYNAQDDIAGYLAWLEFNNWLCENITGAQTLAVANAKQEVPPPPEPENQPDGFGKD